MHFHLQIGAAAACLALGAMPASAAKVYGLVGSDRIVTFDAVNPAAILSDRAILGLSAGDVLTGIDIRPIDGLLYSVGTSGNVYRLSRSASSYTATLTGIVTTFPFPGTVVPITGRNFGIDFAPFDRIRLVSDLDQNLRINPLNGGAAIDAPINDGAGVRPYDLIGVAFADGSAVGAPFYGIDSVTSSLLRGGLAGVYVNTNLGGSSFDPLGVDLDRLTDVGFDILFTGGVNRAFLSADDSFYRVDLTTGRASLVGGLGISNIRGISVAATVPEPASWATLIVGFGLVGIALRRGLHHAKA